MDSNFTTTLPALKFICGESDHICRLCFASTKTQELSLQDSVKMQRHYIDETITFSEIFSYFGIAKESELPQDLCMDCATLAVNSYLFHKICQYSEQKWNDIINKVDKALIKTDNGTPAQQTVFYVIENNDLVTYSTRKKCKTKIKAFALKKLKLVLRARQKYLIKKKHRLNISCDDCGDKFTSRIKLERHIRRVHENSTEMLKHPCKECAKVFRKNAGLQEHIERMHYPKTIQCSKCSEMFGTERMLVLHTKSNHTPMTCKLCNALLPSKIALRSHLDKHDANKCPMCNKILRNKQTFKFHLKICGNDEMKKHSFFCDICKKGYARKFSIRAHLKIDHGFGKVLICNWCGKRFDVKSKLNNHIVKHTRERNFHCLQCNGKFVSQAALVYHTRLHTGERPFPCDLCSESFLSASRRMEHKRRKHFGPSKECEVCHAKFITSSQLKKHTERHYNPHSKLFKPNAPKINLNQTINNNMNIYET